MRTPKLSVIMSVYNEKDTNIMESVQSILNQSMENFEFIIINDNPGSNKNILKEIEKKDSRIKVYENKRNLGLAQSMNIAARVSRTDYLVRMDADDISHRDRLAQQYKDLKKGYDLVFSSYNILTESLGSIKPANIPFYSDAAIKKTLPFKNIIHHPTVAMSKAKFFEVGGYRDFPVAQDYDLWLRFYQGNAKFHMNDQALLTYRTHDDSTTSTKRLEQKIVINYTQKLFRQSMLYGRDNFSLKTLNKKLDIKRHDYEKKKFDKSFRILQKSKRLKAKNKKITSVILRMYVFITNKYFRNGYIVSLCNKMLLKKKIKERDF